MDYLILTASDMMEAAPALAAYRASRGLRTLVAYIEDVYDEFIGNVIGDPDQTVNPHIATKKLSIISELKEQMLEVRTIL